MGIRTQQSPRVEAENRALITAIKAAAAKAGAPELKLDLRNRRIVLKAGGAEVAKIGASGAVDWLRTDLKPAATASSP